MNEEIKNLTFDDEEIINSLTKKCLCNGDTIFTTKILPTEKNVDSFFRLEIFPIIFDEDPILGFFSGKNLLGLSYCSTKINSCYDLAEPTSIGGLTMCDPDFRHQGIGSKLRLSLISELRARSIKKFIFEIRADNEASLNNAQKISKIIKADAEMISLKFEGSSNVLQ
tara:strand:+ start:2669 stop:3172 length:504 start_codon:yes stop_codon:yes gene_type:complete